MPSCWHLPFPSSLDSPDACSFRFSASVLKTDPESLAVYDLLRSQPTAHLIVTDLFIRVTNLTAQNGPTVTLVKLCA